MQFLPRL